MEPPTLKHCPLCSRDLPVSEFGVCRSRRDGRNLYCKECIREKVKATRRLKKEHKTAHKRAVERIAAQLNAETVRYIPRLTKATPVDRVRSAIGRGYNTQAEIRTETKLSIDEIGDALAYLILQTNEIRTQLFGDTRKYFRNTRQQRTSTSYPAPPSFFEVARKAGAPVVKGERRIQRVA